MRNHTKLNTICLRRNLLTRVSVIFIQIHFIGLKLFVSSSLLQLQPFAYKRQFDLSAFQCNAKAIIAESDIMKLHSAICLAFLCILSVASISESSIVRKCQGRSGSICLPHKCQNVINFIRCEVPRVYVYMLCLLPS